MKYQMGWLFYTVSAEADGLVKQITITVEYCY